MSDKSDVISNLTSTADDVMWTDNDDFHAAECLPIIGSCQVSSILSTLEKPTEKGPETEIVTFKSIPINIMNSEKQLYNGASVNKKQLFHEMIYFGCNLCPFICTKDSKITDHIQSVHKTKEKSNKPELKCPGCLNIFYHKLSLKSHLIHDHEVGRNDINKIVNSIAYNSVLSSNNNNAEITTPPTTETIIESELFPVNELVVNLPKEETAVECDVKMKPAEAEMQKQKQKCCVSTCAVRMSSMENMSYHIKCHFGKIFRCVECAQEFMVWKALQTHLWTVHKRDMELYCCDKCNYKTYSLAKLNNTHKLIHGDEKPFLCDLCGKGFKNPKQLRNHKTIHRDRPAEKLHQCPSCQRPFADKRLLRTHQEAVHQKLRPFPCAQCSYRAASNGALQLHVRVHMGVKPFRCNECNYASADHNSLRRHKLRHSGLKKYKCVHCDYACIQSSTYKTHLKTKHPGLETDLMFSCQFCSFRSINKDKYLIHLSQHKEKPAADNILNLPATINDDTSNVQYFYTTDPSASVLLEIVDDKAE